MPTLLHGNLLVLLPSLLLHVIFFLPQSSGHPLSSSGHPLFVQLPVLLLLQLLLCIVQLLVVLMILLVLPDLSYKDEYRVGSAILDFAGGAVLQAVSERPLCR